MKLSELKEIIRECIEEVEKKYNTKPPKVGLDKITEPMAYKKKSLSGKIYGGIRKMEKKMNEGGGTRQRKIAQRNKGYKWKDVGTDKLSHPVYSGIENIRKRRDFYDRHPIAKTHGGTAMLAYPMGGGKATSYKKKFKEAQKKSGDGYKENYGKKKLPG